MSDAKGIIIEGVTFTSIRAACAEARFRYGYVGSDQAFYNRAAHGYRTWKRLSAPIDPAVSKARSDVRAKQRTEMAIICARIDARKVAL